MIRLERTRARGAIPSAFYGPKRIERALTLLTETGAKVTFDKVYWKKSASYWKGAKDALKLESGGKCAYCEAPTDLVAHGDVEHFRPKSHYWWLAFCYDNYLYSCQICNQTYKGDEFPVFGTRMPEPVPPDKMSLTEVRTFVRRLAPDPLDDADGLSWAEFEAAHNLEGTALPNPYLDKPERLFRWEADRVLKEVALKSRERDPDSERAVAAADRSYGLNREELRRWRWRTYDVLETLVLSAQAPEIEEELRARILQRIEDMISPGAAFTGMARFFVLEDWGFSL